MHELVDYGQGEKDGGRRQGQAVPEEARETAPRLEDLVGRALREIGVEELEHADFEGGRVLAARGCRYVWRSLDDLSHCGDHGDDG